MKIKLLVLAVVLAALGILAINALFVVTQTQQAIVLQFGEPKRVVKQAGLAIKVPLIQNVLYYDNRVLDLNPPGFELLLTNKKRIVVDSYARYRIVDPLAFFRRVGTESVLRDRFEKIINASVRRVIATVSLADVLSEKRADIMNLIQASVSQSATSYGIEIVDIRIGRTNLPAEVRESVFARMRSEREREARELRAEGREAARKIRAQADYRKAVLLADAERQARILRGEGDAARTRILGESFRRDPAFFDFYKSLDEYREHLVDPGTTMVLSPDSTFFRYFNSARQPGQIEIEIEKDRGVGPVSTAPGAETSRSRSVIR